MRRKQKQAQARKAAAGAAFATLRAKLDSAAQLFDAMKYQQDITEADHRQAIEAADDVLRFASSLPGKYLQALGAWPRYRRESPRLGEIWQREIEPIRKKFRGGFRFDVSERLDAFATPAVVAMQALEGEFGRFPAAVRWAIYEAFAEVAGDVIYPGLARAQMAAQELSARLNRTKRQKKRRDAASDDPSALVSIDERDERIVAAWVALKKELPGKGERDRHLAAQHDLDERTIFNITRKAGVRGKQT